MRRLLEQQELRLWALGHFHICNHCMKQLHAVKRHLFAEVYELIC